MHKATPGGFLKPYTDELLRLTRRRRQVEVDVDRLQRRSAKTQDTRDQGEAWYRDNVAPIVQEPPREPEPVPTTDTVPAVPPVTSVEPPAARVQTYTPREATLVQPAHPAPAPAPRLAARERRAAALDRDAERVSQQIDQLTQLLPEAPPHGITRLRAALSALKHKEAGLRKQAKDLRGTRGRSERRAGPREEPRPLPEWKWWEGEPQPPEDEPFANVAP